MRGSSFAHVAMLVLGVLIGGVLASVGDTGQRVVVDDVGGGPTSTSRSADPPAGDLEAGGGPGTTDDGAGSGTPASGTDDVDDGATRAPVGQGEVDDDDAPAAPSDTSGDEQGGGSAAEHEAEPEPSTEPVRGVTEDTVKIGVAVPDLSALRMLGPAYDNGDPQEQWEAMLDGWRRDGLLPIHGRDVELVFEEYGVINAEEQRAACVAFIQDHKVFAVVGITFFATGADCVAGEFRTPLITADAPNDGIMARGHPFLFSLGMSISRNVRNMIHFANHHGLLDDAVPGIYRGESNEQIDVADTIRNELESAFGVEVAAEVATDQGLGGPQDAVAVRRFQQEGVNLAILLTSKSGFMQQAETQRYRPTYLESDYQFGTSDTAASSYPPEQFDGTLGITGRRVGEAKAGMSLDAQQEACLANYERYSGEERPPSDSAEYAYILEGCDEGTSVLLSGLRDAGRDLTPLGFVRALEGIENETLRQYAPATYRPDKHHGSDFWRTVRWHADCTCWRAEGPFQPLWVK